MLGLATGDAASLKSCTKGGQTVKRYRVYSSDKFRVEREGVLLIIRQLSLRDNQASAEVTLQGDEGYELQDAVEALADNVHSEAKCVEFTDHLLGAYF